MNEEQSLDDRMIDRWLDRLADGELDESSRRLLMDWLEEDPFRWRRCALTLLESKEFERSTNDWAVAAMTAAFDQVPRECQIRDKQPTATAPAMNRQTHRSHWHSFSTVAILALVMFGVGMIADRCWMSGTRMAGANRDSQPSKDGHQLATDDGQMASDATNINGTVHRSKSATGITIPRTVSSTRPAMLPDYVRGQLERQGYRVDSQQRLVSVVLPGGEQMTIPVEEWKFQFAGNRVY